jgi:hypothetical protein
MRARGTVHVATRRFHVCRRTQCDERVLRYNGANPSEMPVAAGSVFTPTPHTCTHASPYENLANCHPFSCARWNEHE